jgi:metal-sulfur cluster biosynthetic enzyme
MIGGSFRSLLLRIFLTCLFCGIGYGLMQLPSLVVAYRKDSARPVNVRSTAKLDPVSRKDPEGASASHKQEPKKPVADLPQDVPAIVNTKNDIETDPLIEALKSVVDPELGINIVDLGLIRKIEDHENGNLTLTLVPTSPLCPYLKHLVTEIKKNVLRQTHYKTVNVEIDLQQRWTPDNLSEQGRRYFFGAKS